MWWSRRGLAGAGAALLAATLAGCGFAPLYGEGTPAAGMRGQVAVDVIEGAPGLDMRERLVTRLGPADTPTHRLAVDLDFERVGVALTTQNVTTRFDVIAEASFALVPLAGGPAVVTGDLRAVSGVSAPDTPAISAFATESAERDAQRRLAVLLADRIVMQLALQAPDWAE
jgi:LPS-assembly lipoprotein